MDRALLVGINAYPTAPLKGCINDIMDMAEYLVKNCGFAQGDIRLLCDGRATTAEILARLNWLVAGARAGDRLFFHYSGHGAQVATRSSAGEVDGLYEVICPVDFDWSDPYMIRDKEFHRIFSSVPAGCEFVWVSDSCHSQDLTRAIPPQGIRLKSFPLPPDIQWRVEAALAKKLSAKGFRGETSMDNVALISGCQSDQTSADAVFNGKPNGALTYFLLDALKDTKAAPVPLDRLMSLVLDKLKAAKKYKQIPGVEGSAEIIARPFLSLSGCGARGNANKPSPKAGRAKTK